jgi:hypothetical protein
MSKVLFTKHVIFLTFLINVANFAFCQNSFSLRGQLLVDKKIVVGAVVTVYDGNKSVAQTATNKLGKFWVDLNFQKKYVLQFKKGGLPVQKVVISTKNDNLKSDYIKSKVVVFSLSSSKQSKEGPSADDAITSFQLNEKGLLEQDKLVVSDLIRIKDNEEEEIDVEEAYPGTLPNGEDLEYPEGPEVEKDDTENEILIKSTRKIAKKKKVSSKKLSSNKKGSDTYLFYIMIVIVIIIIAFIYYYMKVLRSPLPDVYGKIDGLFIDKVYAQEYNNQSFTKKKSYLIIKI